MIFRKKRHFIFVAAPVYANTGVFLVDELVGYSNRTPQIIRRYLYTEITDYLRQALGIRRVMANKCLIQVKKDSLNHNALQTMF
jgi:hypothetical protein